MSETTDGGRPIGAPDPGDAMGNMTSPKRQAKMQLWETEDFLAAKPYPLPEVTEEALRRFIEAAQAPTPTGGNASPGGRPSAASAAEQTLGGYSYPPPFNQHEVAVPYTTYPYVTVGKLFFNQNGGSYVASAASIGNYAIWTAGHCVHAGDNKATSWSTNLVFVPAYKDGAAPLGQWPASYLMCRTVWYQNGNPGGLYQDMGGAVLQTVGGLKISQKVGWLGFAWNFSRSQTWHSIGYPAESPFNGQRMWDDQASYANDGSVPGSPATVGIGCSMTGGCSGGPWIMGFGAGNYVNGHNSYRPTSQPLEIYSPYFDDTSAHSLMTQLVSGNP